MTETTDQSILQLNTTTTKKYISNINTTETSSEISKRSRADKIKKNNNNTFSHVFFTTILYTLHFLYITFIAFKTLYSYLENLFRNNHYDIHQRIQFDKSQLTKIPKHLTINVSRELSSTRSCKDWEKLMYDISLSTCWAWDFGIKEISVYDASGIIKSMSIDLYKQQSIMLHDYMIQCNDGEKIKPGKVDFV